MARIADVIKADDAYDGITAGVCYSLSAAEGGSHRGRHGLRAWKTQQALQRTKGTLSLAHRILRETILFLHMFCCVIAGATWKNSLYPKQLSCGVRQTRPTHEQFNSHVQLFK